MITHRVHAGRSLARSLAVLLVGCGTDVGTTGVPAVPPVSVGVATTVRIDSTIARLERGTTTALTAVVRDAQAHVIPDAALAWRSSAPEVARVIRDVTSRTAVYAVTAGTAILTAQSGDVAAPITITVTDSSARIAATIAVGGVTRTLWPGENATLPVVVRNRWEEDIAGADVSWASSSPGVATVSPAGVVRGVGSGTARITATSGARSAMVPISVSAAGTLRVDGPRAFIPASVAQLTVSAFDTATQHATSVAGAWTTSDDAVASVSPDGVVTGGSAGTATISVLTARGTVRTEVQTRSLTGRIAFVSADRAVQIMTLDGRPPTSLGYEVGGESTVSLSPDGTVVAFDCAGGGVCVATSGGGGPLTRVSLLYDDDGLNLAAPHWTSDGQNLVVQFGRFAAIVPPREADTYTTYAFDDPPRRPQLAPVGLVWECIVPGARATWTGLCAQPLLASRSMFVEGAYNAAFSSESGSMSFDTPTGLCRAELRPPVCTRLFAHDASERIESTWSPGDTHIAFARHGSLWVMDATGENVVQLPLASLGGRAVSSPSWGASPRRGP